jgi:hypothetical protein
VRPLPPDSGRKFLYGKSLEGWYKPQSTLNKEVKTKIPLRKGVRSASSVGDRFTSAYGWMVAVLIVPEAGK